VNYNLFNIFASADKELVHSSMLKFLIDLEGKTFLQVLGISGDFSTCNIDLEKSCEFKGNELIKKAGVRFDVLGVSKDQKIEFIIENKFKAVPGLEQLKLYDAYLQQKNLWNIPKVLMVFSRSMLTNDILNYCKEQNWNVQSYISLGNDKDSLLNKLSLFKESVANVKIQDIIVSYIEYLESFKNQIESFIKTKSLIVYDEKEHDRFIYFQYLLYVQSKITNSLALPGIDNIRISNGGSSTKIPTVNFWEKEYRHYEDIFLFASCDGGTFKIGIHYPIANILKNKKVPEDLFNKMKLKVESLIYLESKKIKTNLTTSASKKIGKEKSVYTIISFSAKSEATLDQVTNEFATIIAEYFS
jgi:hypothetical protein